jgi:hypothetical protein
VRLEPKLNGESVCRMSTPPNTLSKDGVLAASEEAAKEPTKFNPKDRVAYVRERVDEIRRLRRLGQNDEQIKEALGEFVKQYPTLFQMAVEPHFDYKQLNMMLGVMDRMAGGMTQHQGSVIVGQSLVNTFVKPMLKEDKKK